jgi:hypothetical protein
MKKIFLSISMIVFLCPRAFAQIEVMSTEQAKEQYASSLAVNSMDKDKSVQDKLLVVTEEMLENGMRCGYDDFNVSIVGVRIFFKEPPKDAVVCVDPSGKAVSLRNVPTGFYTIVGELRFKEQVERYIQYVNSLTMPSSVRDVANHAYVKEPKMVADSVLIRKKLSSLSGVVVERDKYLLDNRIIESMHSKVLILEDKDGKNYCVWDGSNYGYSFIACSYIEKLDESLKGQDCVISLFSEFFVDEISGETVAAPDRNKKYRCEKIIMVDTKLVGIFTDDTDSYALILGPIATWLIERAGGKDTGDSYGTYSLNEEGKASYFQYNRIEDRVSGYYVATCDAYIDIGADCHRDIKDYYRNIHGRITPVRFTEKLDSTLKDVKLSWQKSLNALTAQESAKIRAEQQANLAKYGSTFGANVNNHKVALKMTKEMCLKSWGYPSERYSVVNQYGEVEVWEYFNALLYFSGDRLVQIEKW